MTRSEEQRGDTSSAIEACRETGLRLLEQRAHSVLEFRRKLRGRKFDADSIEAVVSDFLRTGLLDDQRFTREYLEYRTGGTRPWGLVRIKADLRKRGVASETIQSVLQNCPDVTDAEQEFERALAVAEKKWTSLSRTAPTEKCRQKLLRFLAVRGFEASVCYKVLEEFRE